MTRNRTDQAIISYGLYLYFSSRSFRLAAARCLSSVIKRTHVAIWKWVQRYSKLAAAADRFRIKRHVVKKIFVDETLLKVDGHEYWLWIAYEPSLDMCLMMHIYHEREPFSYATSSSSSLGTDMVVGNLFSQMVLYGTIYRCKWLRLKHEVYTVSK